MRGRSTRLSKEPIPTVESLVGRQVVLSIGEPWDFRSTDGEARLCGRITGWKAGRDRIGIELSVTPFKDEGQTVTSLVAFCRYPGESDGPTLLAETGEVTVNFYTVPGNRFAMIGAIHLQ